VDKKVKNLFPVMKLFKISVVLSLITTMLAPAIIAAAEAQVVAEDPDGSLLVRGGSTMMLDAGDLLREGDVIKTRTSTVVVSVCDGALVTIYPNSEVAVTSLSEEVAVLNLVKGELLGDTVAGCDVSIANKVGTADISNGVYGVLLNQTGQGWTLQVRNLDGSVTFTGGNIDTTNITAALLQTGKAISIPAGQQLVISGSYNPSTNIFTPIGGAGAISIIPQDVVDQMQDDADKMDDLVPGWQDSTGGDGTPVDPGLIEVPYEDIETASDKG